MKYKVTLLQKFLCEVRRYGLIGLVIDRAKRMRPSVRAELRKRRIRSLAFDKEHNVDTAGVIPPWDVDVSSGFGIRGAGYEASDPQYFADALRALPIDHAKYVFIDFGSGKGRALLLAAEFPFKKITGIEYSKELHDAAQENIRNYKSGTRQCLNVESVFEDAAAYPLPDECLVCYFFNPFAGRIMVRVLDNIIGSYRRRPRDIFIVYYNPKCAKQIDDTRIFKKVYETNGIRVWRAAYSALE
jgi:SAM-dependent methyltransferase